MAQRNVLIICCFCYDWNWSFDVSALNLNLALALNNLRIVLLFYNLSPCKCSHEKRLKVFINHYIPVSYSKLTSPGSFWETLKQTLQVFIMLQTMCKILLLFIAAGSLSNVCFCETNSDEATDVDPTFSGIFGPGLAPDKVRLPCQYFFIRLKNSFNER